MTSDTFPRQTEFISNPMLHDEVGVWVYFCMHSEGGKIFFLGGIVEKSVSHAKKRSAAALLEWSSVQGCDFSLAHTIEEMKNLHLMEDRNILPGCLSF